MKLNVFEGKYEMLKNIMKSGITSTIVLKKDLLVNQCKIKNIQKLK